MRAAIYARSAVGGGCDKQLRQLRAHVVQNGWEVMDEYVDDGVSGLRTNRTGLRRMFVDAERRNFDSLVVSDVHRLSRDLPRLMQHIERLRELGVRLIVTDQKIDGAGADSDGLSLLQLMARLR